MASAQKVETTNGTEAPKRTRRAPEGPRKIRPVFTTVRVTDAHGEPVEGAKVEVIKTVKTLDESMFDAKTESGVVMIKVPLEGVK